MPADGQTGDAPAFEEVMARIRAPRTRIWEAEDPTGGRSRGSRLLFPRDSWSSALARYSGCHSAAGRPDGHRLRRGRAGGRPPGFDTETYKQRKTIERLINRLKQWRGLAMRTDKLASPTRPHSTSPPSSSGSGDSVARFSGLLTRPHQRVESPR